MIESRLVAIKTTEILGDPELAQSEKAYVKPPKKKIYLYKLYK